MKKLIILSIIGIGIYLILSKRKAYAEEVSEIPAEIPATPWTPDNPAVNMVDQILKELGLAKERITSLEEQKRLEVVTPLPSVPEKICKEVSFTIPAYEVRTITLLGWKSESTTTKTICGGTQDEIVTKAEQMREEIAKEINKGDGMFWPRQSITSKMITYKVIW